jgi:hypothetical protein
MRTLIVMAVLATMAFAGTSEFGAQLGYWFPTGDAGDVYAGNFYFGGQFISHMSMLAIEASLGYSPLKLENEVEGADFSGHIIPITAGVRSYTGSVYGAAGIELDMFKAETTVGGVVADSSETYFGGYLGAGLIAPLAGVGDLDVSARLHFMDFDDIWVGLGVGINF